ncbi:MAG: hypothetical protein P8X98_04745 [Woeseiaceae bacterium]
MNTRVEAKFSRSNERWYCRCLWVVSFVAILPVAVIAQLTRWHWQPWSPGAGGYRSAVREANSIANVIVGQSLSGF